MRSFSWSGTLGPQASEERPLCNGQKLAGLRQRLEAAASRLQLVYKGIDSERLIGLELNLL